MSSQTKNGQTYQRVLLCESTEKMEKLKNVQLLYAANVKLPSVLSNKGIIVVTKKKLQTKRKNL